jgi:hypothetical protein
MLGMVFGGVKMEQQLMPATTCFSVIRYPRIEQSKASCLLSERGKTLTNNKDFS